MEITALNTLVVGTGAAGYNAAIQLKKLGVESVAIATEGVDAGTSRNTGSDKQTYYKLSLAGDNPDSVRAMAQDLFACGCVDGDNALVEAALSTRCFMNLCELGVRFPTNQYGEYVGYKTDHDPCARATSVGPLTSKEMTERLQAEAEKRGITVFDHTLIISVIHKNGEAVGALALDVQTGDLRLFRCKNLIFATGGPGGLYEDSVYPACHNGSSGVLFEAGATGQNLTYWQYGLASVHPRWNVSGTYMQVLPRFVSVSEDGKEHEFLSEYFEDEGEMLSMIFLKGYQWPFDSRKVMNGSSVIDLLVYRERVMRSRRVFLDFTQNPGRKMDYTLLSSEARTYLENAGACFGTPIERLMRMNQPAVDLYTQKGVDLMREKLEIALCAQHNNGGIAVDAWWQSTINGLFVCGEAAGTHGISRPGGSALNAGQVGSLRAAQYIAAKRNGAPISEEVFLRAAEVQIDKHEKLIRTFLHNGDTATLLFQKARRRMSSCGGALRQKEQISRALFETENDLTAMDRTCGVKSPYQLIQAYRLRDCLIAQKVYLFAMMDAIERSENTSGSSLCYDPDGILRKKLEETFRFTPDDGAAGKFVQEIRLINGRCVSSLRPVRPIPEKTDVFETVWRGFRQNGNID